MADGEASEANGQDHSADLWRLCGNIREAAALAARRTGYDPERADTLPRVHARISARALSLVDPDKTLSELYDPDSVGKQFYHPTEEIIRHAYIPIRSKSGEYIDPPQAHRVQVIEKFEKGVPVLREHMLHTGKALYDLTETREYRRSRLMETTGEWHPQADERTYACALIHPLREAWRESAKPLAERRFREVASYDPFAMGGNYGTDGASVTAAMDQEFIPIQGGPSQKQLYTFAHWEATAKCFEMKNHSELARATCEMVADFTLGRGLTWKIISAAARGIWEEFWEREHMEQRVRQMCSDSVWQGELMLRKTEVLRGFLRVRSMDPSSIYEIVTDPEDIEQVFYYSLLFPTQWQNVGIGQQPDAVRLDVPVQKYVVAQLPPKEVYHAKLNVTAFEKWGRADYFCALGTLKRLRDWTNAATLKEILQANLVWHFKIHGDDTDVAAFANDSANAQLPPQAGALITNDGLDLEPLHQDVSSRGLGRGSAGDFLIALYATSQQFPATYFNHQAGGAARATALVASEPAAKKIATRQQFIRSILDHLYECVMRCAVNAGRIDAKVAAQDNADPEWTFPSVFEEDRGAKFRDLDMAREKRAISHRRCSTSMAADLGFEEYDYDEEQEEVAKDLDNATLQAAVLPMDAVGKAPGSSDGTLSPREEVTGASATAQFKQDQQNAPGANAPPVREVGRLRLRALSESDGARIRNAVRKSLRGDHGET